MRALGDQAIERGHPFETRAGAVLLLTDQHNVAITALIEVIDGLLHRVGIVQPDQITVQLLDLAIDQHHRQFLMQLAQLIKVMT